MDLVTHKTSEIIDRHPDAVVIRQILQRPAIRYAFDRGAWIAGGFARAVFLGKRLSEFFSNAGPKLPGDIDLFFDSQEEAASVIELLTDRGYVSNSYGGNAKQTTLHLQSKEAEVWNVSTIQLQVVNNPELILPIREQLARFDFTNVCCAFKGEEFLAPSTLLELETNHLLDIKSSASPYLAARVRKYMRRGFVGVTDGSRQHITDWLIRAIADDFKGVAGLSGTVKDTPWCKDQIKSLLTQYGHILRSEDLIMMIGMFKREVGYGHYGDTFVVDEALEALNLRRDLAA